MRKTTVMLFLALSIVISASACERGRKVMANKPAPTDAPAYDVNINKAPIDK